MTRFIAFLALSLVFSCAPIRVNYDYETGTDFSKYKTYNMYPNMETGLSDLDTKRLLNAIDHYLQAKGLTLDEDPDFFVNITSDEYQADRGNTVGVGLGGTGRNVGGGISVGIPIGTSRIGREIFFDFIDAKQDFLFWQAISDSSLNPNATPEKRQAQITAIVSKVLSAYPPEN